MTTYSAYGAPAPQTLGDRLLDGNRAGSVWGQVLVGAVGVVLAVVLVVGQISLATTKGIQRNLATNVEQLKEGNATMKSVIVRAQSSTAIDTLISKQAATLARTNATMGQVNKEMVGVGATTRQLGTTVDRMDGTSAQMADQVAGMVTTTANIARLLGGLPLVTDNTHKRLTKIGNDTGAINAELEAIGGKMESYGLPQARGVQKR